MQSKFVKYTFIIVLGLFALLAVYYTFSSSSAPEETTAVEEVLPTGPESLYLPLTDMEGNPVQIDSTKLAFVNVWATWCGPCNMEMPSIQTLYNKYKDNSKMAFYIISDEDAATVTPFIQRKGYQLPFFQYAGTYPRQLDGDAIPRTYILRNGQVLAQEIGANNWDDPKVIAFIEQQLQSL
ncbi:TlpA family protein disulfide reductase [Telluribacter sp.]|jgi:thiol-disulfide isomerase/thioredoxin|uniref:TlpA family protein disulfide reductase n=1 Tax=Telluribacter sp. TaxID=1978767 RepID=UPI002E1294C8|nr:redoxin family protein [Telluribacter sp.]